MDRTHDCDCSRRSFLRGAGLTLAGFSVTSLFPGAFLRQAMATTGSPNKRLLFIFLRGGNDGINTVIPHGDSDYNSTNRPNLYIPPASAINLNGFASLHPGLQDMMDVYNAGDLAVVQRVGFPNNSQSHFDDQRIWENGNPASSQSFEGWLYRYIYQNALSDGVLLPALSVQGSTPVLIRGDAERYVNIANPNAFDYVDPNPKRSKYSNTWRTEYANARGLEAYRPFLSDSGVKLVDTLDEYRSWNQLSWNPKDPNSHESLFPVDTATNPPSRNFSPNSYPFFLSLKICALSLLESTSPSGNINGNGTRVAGIELNGFDTHQNQGQTAGAQRELLSWIAYGFRSLRIVLSGAAEDPRSYPSIWNDTVVATMSEFGRTTIQNGSFGTDHARASCLFVEGGSVNGGVYNCDSSTWPPGVMFGTNDRYLLLRTDYRAIFWEILRDHMGASASQADAIFPNYTNLGLGAQELGII